MEGVNLGNFSLSDGGLPCWKERGWSKEDYLSYHINVKFYSLQLNTSDLLLFVYFESFTKVYSVDDITVRENEIW